MSWQGSKKLQFMHLHIGRGASDLGCGRSLSANPFKVERNLLSPPALLEQLHTLGRPCTPLSLLVDRNRPRGRAGEVFASGSSVSARSARVEQVVDVPAGQMVEVSQYPGDTVETVELRKNLFESCTDRDECQAAFNELTTLMSAQCGQVL